MAACLLFSIPAFRHSRRTGLLLIALSLAFCAGYLRQNSFNDLSGESASVSHLTGSRVEVRGVVFDVPERGRRTTQVCINAQICRAEGSEVQPCDGAVILYIGEMGGNFAAGDLVSFTARLRPLSNSGNPGEFDYAAYLRNRGFRAAAFLRKPTSIKIITPQAERGILARADAMRGEIAAWMDANIADAQDAAVIKALTIGLRKGISDEIQQAFARGGTAHLLSISGLHLGVIALLVYLLMIRLARLMPRLMLRFSAEQMAALATLLPLWGFALLASLRVSTMRSAITATIYLAGRLLRRPADGLNSLALAAIVVLALYPFSLYEAAFQLSFMCVAAIIIGTPVLEAALPRAWAVFMRLATRRAAVVRYLFFIFVSSILTFVVTLPILLAQFHQLSWMGLFSNLLLIPSVTLIVIPIAMSALVLHLAGLPLADSLLQLAAIIFDPLMRLQTSAVEHLGGAWYFASLPLTATALYYASLALLAAPWIFSRSWLDRETLKRNVILPRIAGALLFCCAIAAYFIQSAEAPAAFSVIIPHARHGSAVVVSDSAGNIEVSGAGWQEPEFTEMVSRVLAPLFWELNTGHIERIFLMQSRIDGEFVQRELGRFFDIGEIANIWDSPLSPDADNRIVQMARSGGGHLPALLYLEDKAALLVVGQPHLLDTEAWRQLGDVVRGRDLAVVWHGPGKPELMQTLARDLKPQVLALAMDSELLRYISKESWLQAESLFAICARSDYYGAMRLTYSPAAGWSLAPASAP